VSASRSRVGKGWLDRGEGGRGCGGHSGHLQGRPGSEGLVSFRPQRRAVPARMRPVEDDLCHDPWLMQHLDHDQVVHERPIRNGVLVVPTVSALYADCPVLHVRLRQPPGFRGRCLAGTRHRTVQIPGCEKSGPGSPHRYLGQAGSFCLITPAIPIVEGHC
jgi:hypothetical protein